MEEKKRMWITEAQEELMRVLDLRCPPVAVSLIRRKVLIPEGVKELEKPMFYCAMVNYAMLGNVSVNLKPGSIYATLLSPLAKTPAEPDVILIEAIPRRAFELAMSTRDSVRGKIGDERDKRIREEAICEDCIPG
jgi:uncharacterized protein (DUF169 family)